MSRNKANKSPDKGNGNSVVIVVAIVGLVGTFVTAYFGFRASTASTAMIIDATKTAQVLPVNSTQISISTPVATYPADCLGYERVEDWTQAAECYKQQVVANSDNFGALSNVARVYGNDKRYDKMLGIAEEMMAVAHNANEGAEVILEMGVAQYYLGDYVSAITSLSMGTDSYYSQTSSYFLISVWLSRSYEANGEIEKACEQYKSTVTLAQQKNLTGSIDEYQSGVQRNCH